jgi:hypothetical protein
MVLRCTPTQTDAHHHHHQITKLSHRLMLWRDTAVQHNNAQQPNARQCPAGAVASTKDKQQPGSSSSDPSAFYAGMTTVVTTDCTAAI